MNRFYNSAARQFYDDVNAAWKSQNYPRILHLINTRQEKDPEDLFALSVKAYHYVFASQDMNQAHHAANTFLAIVVNEGANQELKEYAQEMARRVTDMPVGSTGFATLTPEQRNALHAEISDFPYLNQCVVLWGDFKKFKDGKSPQ